MDQRLCDSEFLLWRVKEVSKGRVFVGEEVLFNVFVFSSACNEWSWVRRDDVGGP